MTRARKGPPPGSAGNEGPRPPLNHHEGGNPVPRYRTTDPRIADRIRQLVAEAPPFSAEQRDRLAVLLSPTSTTTAERAA